MAVNKVVYGDRTLIDLSNSTIGSGDVRDGRTAYGSNGEPLIGSYDVKPEISGGGTVTRVAGKDDDYSLAFA